MAVRELRVCDVCDTDYSPENPAWMIMTIPNAPEEMGEVVYDFCSFNCLHDFVTSPDEDEMVPGDTVDEERPETGMQPDGYDPAAKEFTPEQSQVAADVQQIADAVRPPMTLAEAMMHGLKPDPHGS